MNRTILNTALLLFSLAGPPALLSQGAAMPKREINKGQINFTSLEKEKVIGEQAARQFERRVILLEDTVITDYIDRIAQNIAKNSDSQFPVSIKIVETGDVNAFAFPGGFLYVNSGLVRALDNEAELAFVIAQLTGHVAARHATENNAKATLLQIASVPSIILIGGVAATAVQEAAQPGMPPTFFKYEQQATKEADELGLEYLYTTGYDPHAAVSFLKELEVLESTGPKQSSMFSTVPPAAERIKRIEKSIGKSFPSRANEILNSSEFDAIKARIPIIPVLETKPELRKKN